MEFDQNGKNHKLRRELSLNCSGKIINESKIRILKEKHYYAKNYKLDGDAPKQFIKAYIFKADSGIRRLSKNSWPGFIAKTAEKWYPHESVIEYMINRIGQQLCLNMNEVYLVKANSQIRFLSKYFLDKNENLIHGAEICGDHLGDMQFAKEIAEHKKNSRDLFTFEFIKDAVRSVFPDTFEIIIGNLVKMLVFDAIVGNNDRHFYNWGVIGTKMKTSKLPEFAPIYDSARGLLWNRSDENIKSLWRNHLAGSNKVQKYINEACPRISIEDNKQANHFELMDFLKRYSPDYASVIEKLSSVENENKIKRMLKKEFYPLFIYERYELIALILEKRFKIIREI